MSANLVLTFSFISLGRFETYMLVEFGSASVFRRALKDSYSVISIDMFVSGRKELTRANPASYLRLTRPRIQFSASSVVS